MEKFYIPIVGITILILLLRLLNTRRVKNRFKGWLGEQMLKSFFKKQGIPYIHNVYIQDKTGAVYQVDFLIRFQKRICAVEVKTFGGTLIPSEGLEPWRRKTGKGYVNIPSPSFQNEGQIRALSDTIEGLDGTPYGTVVVTGKARYEGDLPKNVQKIGDFKRRLVDYKSRRSNTDEIPTYTNDLAWSKLKNLSRITTQVQMSFRHKIIRIVRRSGVEVY